MSREEKTSYNYTVLGQATDLFGLFFIIKKAVFNLKNSMC